MFKDSSKIPIPPLNTPNLNGFHSKHQWETPTGCVDISLFDNPMTGCLQMVCVDTGTRGTDADAVIKGIEEVVGLYLHDTENPDFEREIIDMFDGISSLNAVWSNGVRIGSVPMAISYSLVEHQQLRCQDMITAHSA